MYTLGDFLESHITPDIHILTHSIDFSNIPVRSISVQELPLDDFVREDELVLSTALGCDKDHEKFKHLIAGAVSAHASAIIFTFNNKNMTIPNDVLDFANSNGMPLFQIPWEYRFSVIISDVMAAIEEEKFSRFKTVQNSLFNLFFEGKSLQEAVLCISQAFNCTVRVTDTESNVVRESCIDADLTTQNNINAQVSIFFHGNLFGYLHLESIKIDMLETDPTFEKYLGFPLSLWFNKKNIEAAAEMRLKNDFVRNLATKNYTSFQEMVQQGKHLGFDLTKSYTCIVMKIVSKDRKTALLEYSTDLTRSIEKTEEIMLKEGRRRQLSIMATNLSLKFTIFLENKTPYAEQEVQQYVDSVDIQIKHEFPDFCCMWGISESRIGVSDFGQLYANASLALQYCFLSGGMQHRISYKDTKKALIISVLSNHTEIKKNAHEIIQPLIDYDENSGVGLLQTLNEYIRTNYNISQTARNLHIHRQSLLYRLKKISSLTGMSIDEHDDLFVLEAFTKIYTSY